MIRFFCALLLVVAVAVPIAAQVPPDAEWRAFETEHFRVSYVRGLEPVARRAAARAEEAFAVLSRELPRAPGGRVELVVANNVDYANGYATPFPTNRIVLYAHPPVDEPELAFYEDWLHLVVLHELVHIFHLDDSEGIWRRLRGVFGRNPLLFPQIFNPGWVTEGLATYYESKLTPAGRVRGTRHDMVLRAAILEDRFFSLDRATGDPVTWPGGSGRYIYGSRFIDYLARTRGPESVPAFVRSAGRQLVPYTGNRVAKGAFGASFSTAWREWQEALRAEYAPLVDSLRAAGLTQPEVLTTTGRATYYPRYAPDGAGIAFVTSTGREEPANWLIRPDGSLERLTHRTTLGPAAWMPGGDRLLYAQLDYVDPYRIYSDLYRAPLRGDQQRLTRGARVWEPDVHPDGRRAVVVTDREGTNALAIHDLATGATRPITSALPDQNWSLPRWSPRGDRIAVARWTAGGLYDVVVLDSTGAVLREITRDRAIDAAPAWSPDGRYVVFSSDRTGIANLFAYDLREQRLFQVTSVLTGAFQPDVSPDGRWIAFSYYQADGYHVARIPFDPASWRPAPPVRAELAAPLPPAGRPDSIGGPARPYSPFPSVLPSTWTLLLEQGQEELGVGIGAGVAGVDAIQRHAWRVEGALYTDRARFQGGAAYRYRGFGQPVIDLSASQNWNVRASATPSLPTAVLERDRRAELGLLLLRPRWRSVAWLQPGAELRQRDFVFDDPAAAANRRIRAIPLDLGATLGAGYSNAGGYAYSIGPQDGFSLSGTLEAHRYLEAEEGAAGPAGYGRLTTRGRAFQALDLSGFAHHVLAERVDLGVESGSRSPGFSIGGASGGSAGLPLDLEILGSSLAFPLRGYPHGVQQGDRALIGSAEYRFPLLLVERGFRLVPLFLDRVWGDVFADAGTAWCTAGCDRFIRPPLTEPFPLVSAGAEVVVELQVGYVAPLPLRFGAAVPLREFTNKDLTVRAGRPEFYIRVGRAF